MRDRKQKGFSLIEIIIATGIMSVVALGFLTMLNQQLKQQSQTSLLFQIDNLQKNLAFHLRDNSSWTNTINHNPAAFKCLISRTACAVTRTPIPKIVDAAAGIIQDTTLPTQGYQADGKPCNGFNALTGSDRCPLRYEATWEPVCITPCINPQIKIQVIPQYKPATADFQFAFNPNKYSITLYKPGLVAPSSKIEIFLTSGTFTVPDDIAVLSVEVWGAGGGGAGTAISGGGAGGGGGGGGYAFKKCIVTPGQVIDYQVGSGGIGGAMFSSGGNGGYSQFGSCAYAAGGAAGMFGNGGNGGLGGGGNWGDVNLSGGNGESIVYISGGLFYGRGGAGANGGGGGNMEFPGAVPGGGGGGGAQVSHMGGTGAGGMIRLMW